ncbi:hypothetical protein TNCV_954101, partial [Trichonephila clavipes]
VRTRHPFRWGTRRIHQIPFVVNNNRADVKTTVAILRDRRPPINSQNLETKEFCSLRIVEEIHLRGWHFKTDLKV